MKKTIFFLLICMFTFSLFANEFQSPVQRSENFTYKGPIESSNAAVTREQDPAPNYSFILNGNSDPTTYLFDSFYDYMPYSYNGHNVRMQPEISMPYGYSAGGLYISYHCSETAATGTDRRAFNSYINPDGTLFGSSATNHYDVIREGFTSVDIDPVTGDPFFCWHSVVEDDNSYDCSITYDNYHLTGATGYWKQPWILFDNSEVSEPFTGHTDDEFIWPVLMVGDAPTEGYRRVHTYGNNFTNNDAGSGNYNSLYGYADFDENDLLLESELDWTYTTFPLMDDQHYNDKNRVNKDMIVKDNKVAFFGNYGDTLFVMLSEDCGETFTWHKQEWKYPVENPLWEDGVTHEFLDDDGETPSELFFVLSNDGSHYNAVFSESEDYSKIVWMSGVNINSAENISQDLYMAAYFYPKIFTFDIDSGEFSFYDMDIQGADPADDQPAIPWDLDEDGNVDEFYTDDGSVYIPLSMASWFYNSDQGYQDSFFHESNFKMVANNNWIVAGWHDSKKLRWAYWGEEGYEEWLYKPEMVFSISDDYGATWSEPLYINANASDNVEDPDNHFDNNYAPELESMLPVNITFGETLEVLSNNAGDYHAKLHIAFFDDNDYGSAAGQTTGGGELNGGKLRYATMDIEFQAPWIGSGSDDNTIVTNLVSLSQNYPNPFNPVTKINFNLKVDADVKLEVFNLKGQLVTTLVDNFVPAGMHTVTWEGKDLKGAAAASGMYFYKLSSEGQSTTKKMILLK